MISAEWYALLWISSRLFSCW